jgi:hypothetical protein
MIVRFLQLMLFLGVTLGIVQVALADYYKYTDASGAVNISNKVESVPQKYRSHMKVIKDETLSKQDTGARKQQQPEPAQEESSMPKEAAAPAPTLAPQGKIAELSARFIWFKPLLYVGAILAAFLIVLKLASVVPSPQLSKLIYLSFFIGVFTFLYKAYVEHVVADSLAVKEKAVTMMKKASVRELLPDEDAPPAKK